MKTFVVGNDHLVSGLIQKLGEPFSLTDQLGEAEWVIFTGGADVWPAYYGERTLKGTHCDIARDRAEKTIYDGLTDKQWKIGICRGGQFLNVMNGGSMWQDVDNHTAKHLLYLKVANVVEHDIVKEVTSTHHQMMIPGKGHDLLAYARRSEYRVKDGKDLAGNFFLDTEVVHYKDTKSFCFQPHPEYGHEPTKDVFMKLLKHVGAY